MIKEAIVLRIQNICKERNIKFNDLAVRSGVTPSTVYSMMNPERKDLSVTTLKKICDGLDISLPDFFNDDIFRNIEQEIK